MDSQEIGFKNLENKILKLNYQRIKKKEDKTNDDLTTQKKKALEELERHGISIKDEDLTYERGPKGEKCWTYKGKDKFHSPALFKDHMMMMSGKISSHQVKKYQYDLGNYIFFDSADDAMNFFIKREFPEILQFSQMPHCIIFIPFDYLYAEVLVKVITREEEREKHLDPEKKARLAKYQGDLVGQEVEETFFSNLKAALEKSGLKNTIVISGWEVKGNKNVPSKEFDFLIVCEELKTVFQIEVKKTYSEANSTKAFEQVHKGYEFFNSTLPFPAENDWRYCMVIYFHSGWNKENSKLSDACKQYILDPTTDLLEWWTGVRKQHQVLNPTPSNLTYLNITKYIFHQMYQQSDVITQTDFIQKTETNTDTVSNMETIFFWTKIQHKLLEDVQPSQMKRVALIAPFGTGKTTLLKEKAKRLLENGQRVQFILFSNEKDPKETILFTEMKRQFQDFGTLIQFHHECNTDPGVFLEVKTIISENPLANFFFDEVLAGSEGFTPDQLNELSEMVPAGFFFWLACQSEHLIEKEDLGEFVCPKMCLPLRYSGNVLEFSEIMKNELGETSHPSGDVDPKNVLNRGPPCLLLSVKKGVHIACAVDQLSYLLNKERAKTIIKIDVGKETVIPLLKESTIKERLIFSDGSANAFREFTSPDQHWKIFVIDTKDNTPIRGTEVPVLVHFTSAIFGEHVEQIYSRAKSKIIIVCNESSALPLVPSNSSGKSCAIIGIHGELMPKAFQDAIENSKKDRLVQFLKNPQGKIVPVDSRTESSQTGLMVACQHATPEIVEILLKANAEVDAIDAENQFPIHYAAIRGDEKIMEKIIVAIKKQNHENEDKNRLFLSVRASKGRNAFHLAAEFGHSEILKLLHETKYFDVDERDQEIRIEVDPWPTIKIKFPDISNVLRDKVYGKGRAPLHLASLNNHLSAIKCLFDLGASKNLMLRGDDQWISCLHIAAERGYTDIVKYLIGEKKFHPNKFTVNDYDYHKDDNLYFDPESFDKNYELGFKSYTPLHLACQNNHLSTVRALIRLGATPGIRTFAEVGGEATFEEQNCLHFAAHGGHSKIVEFLIVKKHFQVDDRAVREIDDKVYNETRAKHGNTPLILACSGNHLDTVKILLQHGANPNLIAKVLFDSEEELEWVNSLMIAVRNQSLDIVKELVAKKVEVDYQNERGMSALHIAVTEGSLEIVQYLVEEGKKVPRRTKTEAVSVSTSKA